MNDRAPDSDVPPLEPGSETEPQSSPAVDFAKDEDVSRGFRQAVRDALAAHARRGNKVVVWKDGRAVWISPQPETGRRVP